MTPLFWMAVEFCNACIETTIIFMFVDAFFKHKRSTQPLILLLVFLVISFAKFSASFFLSDRIPMIMAMTIVSVLVIATIRGKTKPPFIILSVVIYLVIVVCSEVLAALLVTIPRKILFSDVTDFTVSRFLAIIIMDLLKIFFVKLLAYIRLGKIHPMPVRFLIPLCFLPFLSILIALELMWSALSDDAPQTIFAVISMLGLVVINMVIFALMEALIRRSENDKLLAQLETQNEVQKNHIEQLMENHSKIAILHHDLKHHVHSFQYLCEAGKFDELSSVISKLAETQQRIVPLVVTDNLIFDAMLSAKKELADKSGILCDWNIRIPPGLPILTIDTCVMLGNALDNAIEACLREEQKRFIKLRIETNKNRILVSLKNCVGVKPQHDGEYLRTSKDNKAQHGFGLQSIRRYCDSIDGEMYFTFDDDEFELKISLPLLPNVHD